MIVRDKLGIIGQHRPDEPSYLDFGDGCMKTSIMEISNNCSYASPFSFLTDNMNEVVRHPDQAPYNDPKETSRDQLIPFMARQYLAKNSFNKGLKYTYFINKDFLGMPHIQWFMRTCKGSKEFSWLGDKSLKADIWYMCKYQPDHELNQAFCIALVLDDAHKTNYVKLLCDSHPNWRKNLLDYWGTNEKFRFQPEIGEAFVKRIESVL